ncbi:RimJ/RimL family protein N-acetyltransferase [Herbinix hemicellulosilytica]|uniref:N-acetyltransferase domain-containing protein n=1 Tax=Herbinix hemicellulosilytica TaxID=1564487 RepID=A0A0H5SH35_HERHM|nr:GNAT family protein [Herbinix hemicellulosilytica]RBP57298.1 RimJ/RimL family protein N-acetyltransferase [Herbinix hemicellulosilytica]CRZ34784.1 hypothetical protein HHT355_1583 [Herbinix hemicellulosilytica]
MVSKLLREVTLKTGEKLILRTPVENDAEALIEYCNQVGGESDNLLYGKNEFHMTVEQEREFIKKQYNNPNSLMVVGFINNSVASIAQISCLPRKRIAHNCEIAISVKKEHWNKGVGSAVMEELIRFAKNHETIRNVHLGVKAGNSKAISLYEKFGFVKVGVHKDYINVNGVYDDLILMELNLNKY